MPNAITINIRVSGALETLAAFRRLPKAASDALREQSARLADSLVGKVAAAARSDSPQSALMATTVKVVKDRVPVISAGGTSRVGSRHTPAYKIVFGSEFGSSRWPQFRPHVDKGGSYWLFKTVEQSSAEIGAAWLRAADEITRDFASGV